MPRDIIDVATRSTTGAPAALLDQADGRSRHFKRFVSLMGGFAAELGGIECLSPAQTTTLRNITAMALRAEQLQGALARGEPIDGGELARLATVSNELLDQLRRDRVAAPAAA